MSFTILGTGSALPAHTVSNEELSNFLDTSDEWIYSRTGIHTRHVMTTESILQLSVQAAQKALEMAHTSPQELDCIICATAAGDWISPSTGCMIQKELQASCPAFDINAACSGFLYAMDVADGLFVRKRAIRVLLVAVEGLSRLLNWKDRSTCVLFGDGAGAAVLGEGDALKYIHLTAEGSLAINVPCSAGTSPYDAFTYQPQGLCMNGKEVYKFAVRSICHGLQKASETTGIPLEKVDHFLLHQANQRILNSAAKKLGLPKEKIPTTIADTANTSASSIPILLDAEVRAGHLHRNDLLMLCAFGSGLTSGTAVLRWEKE
ncbi:beta-ketoacyl-ACP synthase III [Caproicibacterium lactatifermentans]|jgi:3-oxoacyl-[acyl-carrier-protein] synthase-3|uniref:Beta-ketoacyl-[acyl-carrier-protein] synthase III n=1 Tax=Caproicibacterium lactatifermentans TaxID=2666138 RepID=A0ABX6PY39_9FIRM|nr:beta-ketoacyl-ACP synthase III [Caproicibacterium lactatifermentans]QKO31047.1 beta-ketoacyl-ACP synthase III [Caproicibacterium lactatifermentans]